MAVEPLRVVTDRWEWASLARQAPSVYHSMSWTLAAVARLRSTSRLPVAFGYLRLWHGDGEQGLIGCPVIRHGEQWTNTQRSVPDNVLGWCADPAAVLAAAVATQTIKPAGLANMVVVDDAADAAGIELAGRALERRSVLTRRYAAMDRRVVAQLVRSVHWVNDDEAADWLLSLRNSWRFGDWNVTLRAYHDRRDEPTGWAVWCERAGAEQCIGVATAGADALMWTSAR